MAAEPSSDFSFDLYPGLDRELDEIYTRNVETGEATPGEVASAGLAAAVGNIVQQPKGLDMLSPEVQAWATEELEHAITGWSKYDTIFTPSSLPHSIADLLESNPNLAEQLPRLYEAKQNLIKSGETNPEGLNIGETMNLVLVPWQHFRGHLQGDGLTTLVKQIREEQGITTEDFFNSDLLNNIRLNSPLYRDLTTADKIQPSSWYLDKKINQDGPWGVMLTQTSSQAGVQRITEGVAVNRSPDAMTNNGESHFLIAGEVVDSMGIFEWLSLTAQEDPRQISKDDYSWLLANRFDVGGIPRVPAGYFRDGRVRSNLGWAGYQGEGLRVRLAVM